MYFKSIKNVSTFTPIA